MTPLNYNSSKVINMTKLNERDISIVLENVPELRNFESFKAYLFNPPASQDWYECKGPCNDYHYTHFFGHAFASTKQEKKARFSWYVTGKYMGEELAQLLPDNPRIVIGGTGSELSPFYLIRYLDKLNKDRMKRKGSPMKPILTVVDICKTPLNRLERAMKHYEGKVEVNTIHDSISKADLEDESQDLYTSDLLWTWIERDEREACFENIHRFLKPNGSLLIREFVSQGLGTIPSDSQIKFLKKFKRRLDYFLKHYFGKDSLKDPEYNDIRTAAINLCSKNLALNRSSPHFNNVDEILNFFDNYSSLSQGKLYRMKLGEIPIINSILLLNKK